MTRYDDSKSKLLSEDALKSGVNRGTDLVTVSKLKYHTPQVVVFTPSNMISASTGLVGDGIGTES